MVWGVITPLCVDGTEVTVKTVRACGDAAEWPPYLFMVRGNSGETEKVGGYTPALVREMLALEKSAVVVDLASLSSGSGEGNALPDPAGCDCEL